MLFSYTQGKTFNCNQRIFKKQIDTKYCPGGESDKAVIFSYQKCQMPANIYLASLSIHKNYNPVFRHMVPQNIYETWTQCAYFFIWTKYLHLLFQMATDFFPESSGFILRI